MGRNTIAQVAAAAFLLAAPVLAAPAPLAPDRNPVGPGSPDHLVRTLTPQQFDDLIRYASISGKDTWIRSDVAHYIVDDDQDESVPVRQLSLGTNHGDKLSFDKPLYAVGVFVFGRRTEQGVVYVFRVDGNLKLITAIRSFTHDRWPHDHYTVLTPAEGQKHLNIVFDEWVQVLEMAKKGHKL